MGGAENTGSARRCSTTNTLVYSPRSPCRNGRGPIPSGYSRVRTLRLYLLLRIGDVSSSRCISKSEKAYFADTRPRHESNVPPLWKRQRMATTWRRRSLHLRLNPSPYASATCPSHFPPQLLPYPPSRPPIKSKKHKPSRPQNPNSERALQSHKARHRGLQHRLLPPRLLVVVRVFRKKGHVVRGRGLGGHRRRRRYRSVSRRRRWAADTRRFLIGAAVAGEVRFKDEVGAH